MRGASPSRTALGVAWRRAAHQVLDSPKVFDDPLALSIVGPELAAKLTLGSSEEMQVASRTLRAFLAVRSRYAEDELARAFQCGTRQYVVLGAGLDTFAYRNPYAVLGLRVFEVDHPATQAWKRDQLKGAGITIPSELTFVAADFERETLGEALGRAGFSGKSKAFFSWLGVVPYLTRQAFTETLEFIAGMPPGSGVVFDFAIARSGLSPAEQVVLDDLASRVASAGEPFQLFFELQELSAQLLAMGYRQLEDLGPDQINSRYFPERADGLSVNRGLGHLMSARL